jgi:integrase/recombinase XerD
MRALTRFDQPQAKPLDPRHVELALRNCHVASRRLAALLMYDAGLRRGEVSRLCWDEHVDFRRDGTVWLYPLGKGSKRRKLVATRRLGKALTVQREAGSPFVVTNARGEQVHGNTLNKWVVAMFGNVNVQGASAHCLRHTFATEHHRKGTPVQTIQEMLGHSSLATTMRYLGVDESDISRAINGRSGPSNEELFAEFLAWRREREESA